MQAALERAKQIKLLVLDVDGVLTNGVLYYGNQGQEIKGFHIHDGLGLRLLQQSGIAVAVISGKTSEALTKRLQELDIHLTYLGQSDKRPAYETLKQTLHLKDSDIAYMGDDLPDLPLLRLAGLAITVSEAPALLLQQAHWVPKAKAGQGAVREVCEFILQAQGLYQAAIQPYLN